MRKISMVVLACSTLAVALPAAAQPFGPPRGPDRYDGRDRGYGRSFMDELVELNRLADRDYQAGRMSKSTYKDFVKRVQKLAKADAKARDRNGGRLTPDQYRSMAEGVDRLRGDYRNISQSYPGGYGRRW